MKKRVRLEIRIPNNKIKPKYISLNLKNRSIHRAWFQRWHISRVNYSGEVGRSVLSKGVLFGVQVHTKKEFNRLVGAQKKGKDQEIQRIKIEFVLENQRRS